MAAPTTYTELTFKQYLHAKLGAVAEVLGWTVADGSYNEIVNETLLIYGVDSIASITGRDHIRKLRALGRVEVWRAVVEATAADYDFKADGGDYKRSQIHSQAKATLEAAQNEAAVYDDSYRVGVDRVVYAHDPYTYVPDEDRTLP